MNIFDADYYEYGSYFMESGHKDYGTSLCQDFCVATYQISYDDYDTFSSAFLSESVTFTTADGAPASYKSWSQKMDLGYEQPRKLKKTVTRTFTLQDNTTKAVVKIVYKDLPPASTGY